MGELHWKTAITKINPNEIRIRGYRIDELMGRVSFADAAWLTLMGELPSKEVGRLIDCILVSSIDHGPTPPSVLAGLTVASGGAALEPCLAGGLLAISRFHGGAVEECMRTLTDAAKRCEETGKAPAEVAAQVLAEFKEAGKRISGYGHRIHTRDPRKDRLFDLAAEAGVKGKHIEMAIAFEEQLAKQDKSIPLNVDGAIAACLCDLSVPIFLANAFFLIARAVGIIAHVHEERTRYRPMRRIDPVDFEYDGPDDRSL
jgi:citrate synthase